MALTPEEKKELAGYAEEDQARANVQAEADERQHLEAQRMRRSIAKAKGWKDGLDFVVLETDRENVNVAVRRPTQLEVEALSAKSEDTDAHEEYVCALVLEPEADDFLKFKVKYPGVGGAVAAASNQLMGGIRAANAKK